MACHSRYASTLVTSEVENTEDDAREVFFNVILPDTAFISRYNETQCQFERKMFLGLLWRLMVYSILPR